MDSKRRISVNVFAIIIILLIAVPEIVGHTLFDKPHSPNSSANAAIALTNKLNKGYDIQDFNCNLVLQNDPSGSNITRAVGMEGKYASYNCK